MSTPLEDYVQQVGILCLQAQSDLAGVDIVAQVNDTFAEANRIVVKASPRQPSVYKLSLNAPAFWLIPLEVTIRQFKRDAAQFNTWMAAVEAAFAGPSFPSAVQTFITAHFTNGCLYIDPTTDGDLDHSDNIEIRGKTFNALTPA